MELEPQIFFGHVMHKRLFPKINCFRYKLYYVSLPLSKINLQLENEFFRLNRWGFLSFYNRDHGYRNNEHPQKWVHDVLTKHDVTSADGEVILVTMPRVLGYVFNPVSFWYCYDKSQKLRAVICEVNNTFGETHSYICVHDDQREIMQDDILEGQKVFHVSPFLEREGSYKFRFAPKADKMGVWIDFYDAKGKKKLLTTLTGKLNPLSASNIFHAFWRYPLVTLKAIFLIHWQAVKLFTKGVKYVPKPMQIKNKVTKTPQ